MINKIETVKKLNEEALYWHLYDSGCEPHRARVLAQLRIKKMYEDPHKL